MVEQIQDAVNAYYSQFEAGPGRRRIRKQKLPEPTPESPDLSASREELAEVQGTDSGSLDTEPGPAGSRKSHRDATIRREPCTIRRVRKSGSNRARRLPRKPKKRRNSLVR